MKKARALLLSLLAATCAFGQQLGTINGVPNQVFILPNPTTSALGGVEAVNQTTNNWVQYVNTSGVPILAQPAFSNLNGSAACGQLPAFSGGDATSSAGSCNIAVGSIGGKSVSLGGSFTTSGAYGLTFTLTNTTSLTLPTAGTLAILGLNTFTRTQTMNVNTVVSSGTPAFDLSQGNVQYVSALANNAVPSFSNITTGGWWKFIVCQNGTGNFTWTWPASVHGGNTIGATASKCTTQIFTSPDGSNLYADSMGVVNQ
jgi:hypothetical protein